MRSILTSLFAIANEEKEKENQRRNTIIASNSCDQIKRDTSKKKRNQNNEDGGDDGDKWKESNSRNKMIIHSTDKLSSEDWEIILAGNEGKVLEYGTIIICKDGGGSIS